MATTFIIQSQCGDMNIPMHDFGYHIAKAVNYQKEIYGDACDFEFVFVSDNKRMPDIHGHYYVPVGGVDFVKDFYKSYYNIDIPKPLNIPDCIIDKPHFEFLNRTVININRNNAYPIKNMFDGDKVFVKSNDTYKKEPKIMLFDDISTATDLDDNIMISDVLHDIVDEYRVFVFRGKAVGIKQYVGDCPCILPIHVKFIEAAIKKFEQFNVIPAYSFDVCVDSTGEMSIIEFHHMFSLGLYGFNNYSILPQMFSQWHHWWLKKNRYMTSEDTFENMYMCEWRNDT